MQETGTKNTPQMQINVEHVETIADGFYYDKRELLQIIVIKMESK